MTQPLTTPLSLSGDLMSASGSDLQNQPQPSKALLAMTYINHVIIVLAAIAISQLSVLVETDPEWGVVIAERPWLKSAALVASAMLGVILFRYSRWVKTHLGVTHRNALLLLVLSAMLAWLVVSPVA